jgi:hypothetical protein
MIPQTTNNLELICGSVAVNGDLTKPSQNPDKGALKKPKPTTRNQQNIQT